MHSLKGRFIDEVCGGVKVETVIVEVLIVTLDLANVIPNPHFLLWEVAVLRAVHILSLNLTLGRGSDHISVRRKYRNYIAHFAMLLAT